MKEPAISRTIHLAENVFLLLIALLTAVGAVKEVYVIVNNRDVRLQDLLLMFLYVEVLAMVGAYYDSKRIPISLPIFIAITALARLTILQKDQDPLNLIYESGAILILAIASVVVNIRPSSFLPPSKLDAERNSSPPEERSIRL
jgi:protein PsiE